MVILYLIIDFSKIKPTTTSTTTSVYKTIVNIQGWAKNFNGVVKIAKSYISGSKSNQPSINTLISSISIEKSTGRAEISIQTSTIDIDFIQIDYTIITANIVSYTLNDYSPTQTISTVNTFVFINEYRNRNFFFKVLVVSESGSGSNIITNPSETILTCIGQSCPKSTVTIT